MNGALGVDKLRFMLPADSVRFTPDFAPVIDFSRAGDRELGSRLLYRDADGVGTAGRLARINTENYQFTIKPNRDGEGSLCFVQFSAGCFAESNLSPLNSDGCMTAALAVQRDLATKGALLSLDDAKLTRVDLARNVQLFQPVESYSPLFGAIGGRKRTSKQDFGGTGFVLGNKQWQWAIYDKAAEMKGKGYVPGDCPVNTLRPELRLMKGGKVKSLLGVSTLSELRAGWGNVHPVYFESLRRELLHRAPADVPTGFDWASAASFAVEHYPRSWQGFQRIAALALMVRDMGLPAAKLFVAQSFGFDCETESGKLQIKRMQNELESAAFAAVMSLPSSGGVSMAALYAELHEKLLAG